MRIRDILDPRHIVLDIHKGTKREILTALSRPLAQTRRALDHEQLVEALVQREETSSTAIADGIAIPHGKQELDNEVICAFGRSEEGVEFESFDGNPTHIFFLLLSPVREPSLHLRWLAHLAVMLRNPVLRRALLAATTPEAVLAALDQEENALTQREAAARKQ
jgi:mannitol/fructose-specific phosphotransferase system IIA component (Ntr-type)